MEEQTQVGNWREKLNLTLFPKVSFADKETKILTFLDEGKEYKHPDYKPSIIFTVKVEGSEIPKNTWFVNAEAYGLLQQIMGLGEKITGIKVSVYREGIRKTDTRYTIKKA